MGKAKHECPDRVCVPLESGFYWATHRKLEWRKVVQVARNWRGKRRVFVPGTQSGFDLDEFTDYVGPLTEATTKPK